MGGHESVLLEEVLEFMMPADRKVVVDGTLGRGGHAAALLGRMPGDGRLIGLDQDPQACEAVKTVLGPYGERAMIINDNFKNLSRCLPAHGVKTVDGILLDLGVSSPQLDEAERGFSFRAKGPLDMRMNPADSRTAADCVNRLSSEELAGIIFEYGEERLSRRIAAAIVEARRSKKIETTSELEEIIFRAVPASYRHGRIHPATRTFQALRIWVNDELGALKVFLSTAPSLLNEGGRLVIISFHSLEDRIVKNAFREFEKEDQGRVVTKKPVVAGDAETQSNPRARSAKLRVFQRMKGGIS